MWTVISRQLLSAPICSPLKAPGCVPGVSYCSVTGSPLWVYVLQMIPVPSLAQTQDRRRRFLQDVLDVQALGCWSPSDNHSDSERLITLQRWHFSTLSLLLFWDFGCPFANKGECKYNSYNFCIFLPIHPRKWIIILLLCTCIIKLNF